MTEIIKMDAVNDKYDNAWVFVPSGSIFRIADGKCFLCDNIMHGIEKLKHKGYIKPDPLQDALDEMMELYHSSEMTTSEAIKIQSIIRTLAEELTDD